MSVNINRILYMDPRGKIIFFDDMEKGSDSTIRWSQDAGTVAFDTSKAFEGAQSLKLTTGVTAGSTATASFTMGLLKKTGGGIGLSAMIYTSNNLADVRSITLQVKRYDGTNLKTAGARWHGTEGTAKKKIQYLNSSGNYTDLADAELPLGSAAGWSHFKLSVDFENDVYKRIILNHTYQSMTQAIQSASDTGSPRYVISISAVTETTTANELYVDNVMVTALEK